MPVYFIQNERGSVKIGHSANPAKRLASLRVSSPEDLTLIRVIEGEVTTEGQMHKHFSAHRIRGEWFRFNDEMLTIGVTVSPPREAPVRSGPLVTHTDILALWPRVSHLAADLEVPYARAYKWTKREYIDAAYWDDLILAVAQRFNIVITHSQLMHGLRLVRPRRIAA
ncbi:MAG TPA: GIY-YIG nuclease family protein [Steroidobacteraceae bacterium]|nr:GIY-YIG nuclease family protein [Steroidobacteraceae bacterium]